MSRRSTPKGQTPLPARSSGAHAGSESEPAWQESRWLIPFGVALLTAAAFLPTIQNEFVTWDDGKNLVNNPSYRGLGWMQVRWMLTTFHMGHYIPFLSDLKYTLNHNV